jgi:hypothetical protein
VGKEQNNWPPERHPRHTCISSGESLQEEQTFGVYYILKGKKYHNRNQCREFILAQIVREYGQHGRCKVLLADLKD